MISLKILLLFTSILTKSYGYYGNPQEIKLDIKNLDGICKSHGYISSSDCQCQDLKAKKGGCEY